MGVFFEGGSITEKMGVALYIFIDELVDFRQNEKARIYITDNELF